MSVVEIALAEGGGAGVSQGNALRLQSGSAVQSRDSVPNSTGVIAHAPGPRVYGELLAYDVPEAVRANQRVQDAYLGSPVADAQAGAH